MDIARPFDRRGFLLFLTAGLVGLSAGVVGTLGLWPGQSGDAPAVVNPIEPERVLVHSLEGDGQAQRLEGLLQVRRTLQSNVAVLARIHADVTRQLALANQTLKQQYGIDPSEHYFYEKATRTLYRLTASEPAERTSLGTEAAAASPSETGRRFLRQLASEEEQPFIGLFAQKQQLLECVVVFGRALRAQHGQLQHYNQVLTAEFNVAPGGQYVINSAKSAVYEIDIADPATEVPPRAAQTPRAENPRVVR